MVLVPVVVLVLELLLVPVVALVLVLVMVVGVLSLLMVLVPGLVPRPDLRVERPRTPRPSPQAGN